MILPDVLLFSECTRFCITWKVFEDSHNVFFAFSEVIAGDIWGISKKDMCYKLLYQC